MKTAFFVFSFRMLWFACMTLALLTWPNPNKTAAGASSSRFTSDFSARLAQNDSSIVFADVPAKLNDPYRESSRNFVAEKPLILEDYALIGLAKLSAKLAATSGKNVTFVSAAAKFRADKARITASFVPVADANVKLLSLDTYLDTSGMVFTKTAIRGATDKSSTMKLETYIEVGSGRKAVIALS